MQALNIVFAGTPDFAVPSLQALLDSPHHVKAVYTQPDRPAGRGRKLTASPIKQCALEHGLPVEQPLSLKDPEEQGKMALVMGTDHNPYFRLLDQMAKELRPFEAQLYGQ